MKKILLLADKYLKVATQLELNFDKIPATEEVVEPEASDPSPAQSLVAKKEKRKKKELSPQEIEKKLNRVNSYIRWKKLGEGSLRLFSFYGPNYMTKSLKEFKSKIKDIAIESFKGFISPHILEIRLNELKEQFPSMAGEESREFILPFERMATDGFHQYETKFGIKVKITKQNYVNAFTAEIECYYNPSII